MDDCPTPAAPLTAAQLQGITDAIATLIALMAPLHQMLLAQKSAKDSASARLEEMLCSLGLIAENLGLAAQAMADRTGDRASLAAVLERLDRLEQRQLQQVEQEVRSQAILTDLTDWLQGRSPAAAEPS